MTTDHGGVMAPCVRIECVVCYSRLSKLKDLNQKRVVWDAFWWYATGPRISDKVIALVQDGGQNWGVTGVLIDHLMSIRRSNQQIFYCRYPQGSWSHGWEIEIQAYHGMFLLIQDSISINGEEILRAGTSGFEDFLGDAKRSYSLDKSGAWNHKASVSWPQEVLVCVKRKKIRNLIYWSSRKTFILRLWYWDIGKTEASGYIQRLSTFMSKSRLLRRLPSGQGLGSCGAVRDQERSLGDRSSDVEVPRVRRDVISVGLA